MVAHDILWRETQADTSIFHRPARNDRQLGIVCQLVQTSHDILGRAGLVGMHDNRCQGAVKIECAQQARPDKLVELSPARHGKKWCHIYTTLRKCSPWA